jgi:hypothetical protein
MSSRVGELPYIALAAALYALGKLATAYIPTPWGTGQLLIFIIIPVFFAFYLKPLSIGVAAALGTFIGDALFLTPLGLTNPLLSIIAGVPANFIGFYLMAWWFRKFKSWNGFALGSFISILLGNFIAASGVVFYLSTFMPSPIVMGIDARLALILGFTLFWQTTMYPAVILLNPWIFKMAHPYIASKLKGLMPPEWALSKPSFNMSLLTIALFFFALFSLVQFTGLGEALSIASPTGTKETLAFLSLACSGLAIAIIGITSIFQR